MIFQCSNPIHPTEPIHYASSVVGWEIFQEVGDRRIKLFHASTRQEAYEAQKQAEDIQELTKRLVR